MLSSPGKRRGWVGRLTYPLAALALIHIAGGPPPRVAPARMSMEPQFSVVISPTQARPGDLVTVSVSSLDPAIAIDGCDAGFAGGISVSCTWSGGIWAVALIVPPDASAGATSLWWSASYFYVAGDGRGGASGDRAFTVLAPAPPQQPRPRPAGSAGTRLWPYLLIVIGLLWAGAAVALHRHRSSEPEVVPIPAPRDPPPNRRVRAVPHPGRRVKVSIRNTGTGRTAVVRLEPHSGSAECAIEEVRS